MKAILVGLGGRGKGWLRDLRENPEVELVAVVEPAPKNKEKAVKELEVPEKIIFDDLADAAKKHKADFIVDVTPPAIHHKVAYTAFEHGLHVLGEKPLSDKYEVARDVVAAGKKAGVKHMITQNYRWAGLPRTTRRLLDQGAIGQVGQLDVSLYVNWADAPGSHYVTQPYMFLTDMGIHHFDMMRYTLGTDCVSARAITWNLPWGWHQGDACQLILFRMANGINATHRGVGCTVGHVPAGHNGEWRYEGPKGTLTWEGFKLFQTHQHKADPKIREEIALDTAGTGGPKQLLGDFLKALKEGKQPECNAEDNLKSMAMVFAALKSAKEDGREVKIGEL
ncbi:MAG: Gfo/Idh/MocA family oxidoreductase [Planctomycetota bacterium]|nr:Gfo/Idh/MocA family oxidoreductase [Planctomycetota bacterium]